MIHSYSTRSQTVVLVLAAGVSARMGERNKLHLPVNGQAMLWHALDAATRCGAESVYLLTGFERERSMALAKPFAVTEIHNPDYSKGQDKSLAVGLAELCPRGCSVLVLLADQPGISAGLLRELINAHCKDGARRALIPIYSEQWGTPRILPAELVALAAAGGGEFSLRTALSSGGAEHQLLKVDDPAVILDIDTPDEYLRYVHSIQSG